MGLFFGMEIDFRKVLNDSLGVFFNDALRISLTNPKQALFFLRTFMWQRKAAQLRSNWINKGVNVPPIMIFSITDRCNLHCKGCYNQALRSSPREELNEERVRDLFAEAKQLGISFIVLGGGEPLVRKEILDITTDFREIIFLVFTNGLLIDEEFVAKMKEQKNLVPVISLEGYKKDTDERRGRGVYARLLKVIEKIGSKKVFWATSLTMTRSNFSEVTDESFIGELVDKGCKLIFFVEYNAIRKGTESWVLTEEQRARVMDIRNSFRGKFSAMFIAIPGDEDEIGGCLSSGRGFIHVSAEGNVEPCPFIPYSNANLNDVSLREALQSDFLKKIRENNAQLSETGGCALVEKRKWIESLLTE
jgi:MoaA/NifB/PqqE/SkfB family radical SAM enzyme